MPGLFNLLFCSFFMPLLELLELLVMETTLDDITFLVHSLFAFHFVHKPMFTRDSPGPKTFQVVPERFWLSCSLKGGLFDFVKQVFDFLSD
jgi:hypothetical protein